MGIKMKKILLSITLTLSISLMVLPTISVYAGDINAVEQDVINYCSGIFYYEGKAYKATPAAVSRAYAELAADDVDLTPEKGEAAKRLAMNNVKRGIDEGYLVEVDMPQEMTSDNTAETSGTINDATSEPGTSDGENTSSEGNTSNDATGEDETTGSIEETTTEPITSKEDEEVTTKPQQEQESESEEAGTTSQLESEVPETDEVENKVTGNGEMIDIENVLQSTNDEVIVNQNTENETMYNVQDYINGEELIVKEEGEVLFVNDLSVKNTGYNLVKGKFVLITIVFLFFMNIVAAVIFNKKTEKR